MSSENGSSVTLSTGVVLRLQAVPRNLFADIIGREDLQPPPVPVAYNPDKGRDEENPHDPEYLKRTRTYEAKLARSISDALIGWGTELVSKPEALPSDKDREWVARVKMVGTYDLTTKVGRYVAWVKTVAMDTDADFRLITSGVKRLMGVPEGDVAEAAKRFRTDAQRD